MNACRSCCGMDFHARKRPHVIDLIALKYSNDAQHQVTSKQPTNRGRALQFPGTASKRCTNGTEPNRIGTVVHHKLGAIVTRHRCSLKTSPRAAGYRRYPTHNNLARKVARNRKFATSKRNYLGCSGKICHRRTWERILRVTATEAKSQPRLRHLNQARSLPPA